MEESAAIESLETDALMEDGGPETMTLMEDGGPETTTTTSAGFDLSKFQELLGDVPDDFETWSSLITHIEKNHPNDIERICLIYDAFLSEYPLCYGYWNKYACHKARLCPLHEVEETFEHAVQAVPYSVDLWVNYCSFGALAYEDPADIRRLYERGLSFVKKDYLCHLLWDKYIDFEHSLKQWSQLAHIYLRTLVFPSKKLWSYYERFKRLADIWPQETDCQNDPELPSESIPYSHGLTDIKDSEYAEISKLIGDFMDEQGIPSKPSFRKYLSIGEQFYHRSKQMDEKISSFEGHIRRRYFHVKPLDAAQLENWHHYLDFVELQGDFDWTVKLYERCLIACANYSEFWIRYVEFVEAKGGREIANHALSRAVTVFLKRVPAFHIYSAMFKEKIGDVSSARALFIHRGMDLPSNFIETVNREANMEKRMGNTDAAHLIYEKAIELAKENENLDIIPNLYINFARFTFVASGSIDAARGVFIRGIQQLPCKSILEGLIHFTTIHGSASDIPFLDAIIANALEPETDVFLALSSQDREDISRLFLEFVDLHGNIHEIRQAWDRHRKLFPHIIRLPFDHISMENSSMIKSRNGIVTELSCNGCLDDSKRALEMHHMKHLTEELSDVNNHSEADAKLHSLDENGTQEMQEQVTHAKQLDQPVAGQTELHLAASEQLQESPDVDQESKVSLECPDVENDSEHSLDDKIGPPLVDNLSLNSPGRKNPEVIPETLVDSKVQDGGDMTEVSGVHEPVRLDTKSITSSQVDLQNDETRLFNDTGSPAIVAPTKLQQPLNDQSHSDSRHDSPASIASPQIGSSRRSWTRMNHGKQPPEDVTSSHQNVQMPQPQHCPINAQMQYTSAGTGSQVPMGQSHPYQSQVWTGTQGQQANQTQSLYQMAAAQAYQTANISWPGQNMLQGLVYVQAQPTSQHASQDQVLVYQQAQQNNDQYGYAQSGQAFSPHIWHYYQQQLYYLQQQQQQQQHQQQQQQQQQVHQQQQQQQNQLIHNVSDQPSQIAPAEQQEENHSQQLALQSQQLLLQLQQQRSIQPNQQGSQHVSSPEQNQKQPHQQEQGPQLQQQDEQANQAQQQQQLLYLQQQQQQQMYLHQQHLYMQQLLQHQFHQQQQQQAPQQMYHQEQILQQQQQLLLLQQQQQLLQMQQVQQQQQQRSVASEIQAQPMSSYIQGEESNSVRSHSSTPQRTPTKQ